MRRGVGVTGLRLAPGFTLGAKLAPELLALIVRQRHRMRRLAGMVRMPLTVSAGGRNRVGIGAPRPAMLMRTRSRMSARLLHALAVRLPQFATQTPSLLCIEGAVGMRLRVGLAGQACPDNNPRRTRQPAQDAAPDRKRLLIHLSILRLSLRRAS